MKHIKSLVCLLLLNGLVTPILAQNTVPATGGNATGSAGSVSYTVGQIAFSTLSGTNGTVTQGVQQPFEISVVTAIRNTEDINLKCNYSSINKSQLYNLTNVNGIEIYAAWVYSEFK